MEELKTTYKLDLDSIVFSEIDENDLSSQLSGCDESRTAKIVFYELVSNYV